MIRLQNLDIFCVRDGQLRTMPMQYVQYDGNILYAPCNGCDFMDGGNACRQCLQRVDRACLHVLSEPVLSLVDFVRQDS